jgi:hypothetical protein
VQNPHGSLGRRFGRGAMSIGTSAGAWKGFSMGWRASPRFLNMSVKSVSYPAGGSCGTCLRVRFTDGKGFEGDDDRLGGEDRSTAFSTSSRHAQPVPGPHLPHPREWMVLRASSAQAHGPLGTQFPQVRCVGLSMWSVLSGGEMICEMANECIPVRDGPWSPIPDAVSGPPNCPFPDPAGL